MKLREILKLMKRQATTEIFIAIGVLLIIMASGVAIGAYFL